MRMAYTFALNSPALTSDISWNYASNSCGAKLKWNQMSWHILLGRFEDATTTVNCVAVWLCGWTVSLWQLRYTLLDSIRRGQEINVAARNLIKTVRSRDAKRKRKRKTQQYNGPRMLFMAVNISNWHKLCVRGRGPD